MIKFYDEVTEYLEIEPANRKIIEMKQENRP